MSSKLESMTGHADTAFPAFEDSSFEPIQLAQDWVQYAEQQKTREPRAMVFSTCSKDGELTSRVMAILEFSSQGILFATHSCSRKIEDVNSGSQAVGHFYWKELGRQLSVSGKIEELDRRQAEIYWNARPAPLHAMSSVARQSEPLQDPATLMKQVSELEGKGPLPCPPQYSVYLFVPTALEFWASSSDRLHRRIRCQKNCSGWHMGWLQP